MSDNLSIAKPSSIQDESSDQNILTAAQGGGILFFGRLFEYASRFVFGVIVTRALGADGFGLYTIGVTTAIMLASFARLGLSEGLIHYLPAAIHKRDDGLVWGILQVGLLLPVLVGTGLAVTLFGLSDILAENLFHEPAAAPVLRWVSVAIPLIALGRVLMAATRGFKYMRYEVYADSIASSLTKLSLTVLFLAIGWNLPGALVAFLIAWIVADGLMLLFLNRIFLIRRPLKAAHRNLRQLLAFSAPICLTQVILQLGGNFELLLLGALNTMTVVGLYSAALRIQMIGAMFLMVAELVAKPIISDLYHKGDSTQLGQLYQILTRWSLAFILPYFSTIILFASPILTIFGEEFKAGALVLIIVSLGTLVNAGTGICGAMIVMTGHSKLTFVNSLVTVILSVALNLILIPTWGLVGAAIAAALSKAFINIIRLVEVYWIHKMWPYNLEFVKPIAASAVALFAGYVLSRFVVAEHNIIYLLLNVIFLWLVYITVTVLLGLSTEDRTVLSRTKNRFGAVLARR